MKDLRIDRARREIKVRSSIIAHEIEEDINNGVYNNFNKLKNNLSKIRLKLLIVNSTIWDSELICLIENDYLKNVNY